MVFGRLALGALFPGVLFLLQQSAVLFFAACQGLIFQLIFYELWARE